MCIDVKRNRMLFSLVYTDEDGTETEKVDYEGLFTFPSEETGKTYLAYKEDTDDDADGVNVYVGILASEDIDAAGENWLQPIETDEEWAVVESILDEVDEEYFYDSADNGFNEYSLRMQRWASVDQGNYEERNDDDD